MKNMEVKNTIALLLILSTKGPMTERELRGQLSNNWRSVGGFPTLWRLTIRDLIKRTTTGKSLQYEITSKGEELLESYVPSSAPAQGDNS